MQPWIQNSCVPGKCPSFGKVMLKQCQILQEIQKNIQNFSTNYSTTFSINATALFSRSNTKVCPPLIFSLAILILPPTFYFFHTVIFKDSNNNVTKTVSSPSFFWWKARYTARFLKNVLVPLVVALRTTKPGDLLKENPYIDENYKKFFDHPSTFSFPENDILVRPYSVQTQNNCIRIRMFQKFPTPVEMNREGKVIGWNGYSSSFTISEFVNNLFTIRKFLIIICMQMKCVIMMFYIGTLGLAYYGKMENLRKQKMENRRKSVGGSNPTASSSSVRTAGRSRG